MLLKGMRRGTKEIHTSADSNGTKTADRQQIVRSGNDICTQLCLNVSNINNIRHVKKVIIQGSDDIPEIIISEIVSALLKPSLTSTWKKEKYYQNCSMQRS